MSLCGAAFVDMSQGSSRLLVAISVYVRCVNAKVVHSLSVGLFYDSLQTQRSIHCQLVTSMILYKHNTMVNSLSMSLFGDSL